MTGARQIVLLAVAFAVVLTLTAATSPAPRPTGSSRTLLLSPKIRLGQTFTWIDPIVDRSGTPGQVLGAYQKNHTDVVTCTALTQEGDAFVLSRRVKVMFPPPKPEPGPTLPPKAIAALRALGFGNRGAGPYVLPKPSIIVQHGLEYTTEWRRLDDDPICKFYSASLFGTPPTTLAVGTSWDFDRTAMFGQLRPMQGTTTVTHLDNTKGIVSLRARLTWEDNPMLVDLVVTEGGVIASESYLSTNDVVDPESKRVILEDDQSDLWTLVRPIKTD